VILNLNHIRLFDINCQELLLEVKLSFIQIIFNFIYPFKRQGYQKRRRIDHKLYWLRAI
jgi:hypothetical protein